MVPLGFVLVLWERAMIKGILLWAALFLWATMMVSWGFLSIFFPRRLDRIVEWYTGASRWSTPKAGAQAQGSLSQKVAGVFAVLIGGWMTVRLLSRLVRFRAHATSPVEVVPSGGTKNHWSALAGGIVIIGFGVYMTLRPQLSLRLTQANFPNRELSKGAVERALGGARVLGVLTTLFGAVLVFLWYRWTH